MRPPEFTGGNTDEQRKELHTELTASMRPPEFTGGNYLMKYASKESREWLQ